jgi:hypothetical protein
MFRAFHLLLLVAISDSFPYDNLISIESSPTQAPLHRAIRALAR